MPLAGLQIALAQPQPFRIDDVLSIRLEPLREVARRACESAPEWDQRLCLLQVVEAGERSIQRDWQQHLPFGLLGWRCLVGLAGGCPAATHFSLLRQRKVSKRKATRLSGSLRFASGNLRCLRKMGGGANSLRSNSAPP